MSQMIEVKTADLIGQALDWAVCKADCGVELMTTADYSTDWAQGGPLIEEYRVVVCYHNGPDKKPLATTTGTHPAYEVGDTVLIAACRAIVAAKLGDVVSVPAELVGGEK